MSGRRRRTKPRAGHVDIGITRITVTGPMRGDGTLTVVAHGRVVELDVQAGDTAREVAQRIALALA